VSSFINPHINRFIDGKILKYWICVLIHAMPREKGAYTTVAVPREMHERIKKVVESGKFGYKSICEFVKDAIRRRLEECGAYP